MKQAQALVAELEEAWKKVEIPVLNDGTIGV